MTSTKTRVCCFFSLQKSGRPCDFLPNIKSVCLWCGRTGGQVDVRSRNYQNFSKVTKFSYPWRSAIKIYIDSCQNRATTDKYHITISKARVVVPKSYRPKEQPSNTRNEFPIRGDFANSLDYEQPLFLLSASSKTRQTCK